MDMSATSLTGNGLRDWFLQRFSSIVLGVYFIYLIAFVLMHPGLDYATWSGLFDTLCMKVVSTLAVLALVFHAWIGVWTVLTDYVKLPKLRLLLHMAMVLALLSYFIWGIAIFWSF